MAGARPIVGIYLKFTLTLGVVHNLLLLLVTRKLQHEQSGKRPPTIVVNYP